MNQISQRNFTSIERMSDTLLNNKSVKPSNIIKGNNKSFGDILNETRNSTLVADEIKFSKHANDRLASRNIDLSNSQMERLVSGTKKAKEKGINESLVMVDNIAFIVNVKKNTVITALNDNDDKIFTNIDGAVIM